MCNINVFIQTREHQNVPAFIQSVTASSYAENNDGEGCFILNGEEKIIKQIDKINYFDYENAIKTASFILTHQRLATSGFEEEYTHPFYNDDFILLHNGILSYSNVDEKTKHSDTYLFFEDFLNKFAGLKIEDRNKRIIKAIKSIFDSTYKGSYSIVLHDRITKKMYYFKNNTTHIHLYKSKDSLFLTTKQDNDLFLTILGEKYAKYKIKDYSIYCFNIENKQIIGRKVGKIKKPYEIAYKKDPWGYREEEKKPVSSDLKHCVDCGMLTDNFYSYFNQHICLSCINKYTYWEKKNNPSYV